MENAVARLRQLNSSAQKTRLVADLIRGRHVDDALQILRTTPKAVSKDLEMLVRSAVANATQKNPSVDVDDLKVDKIFVDNGNGREPRAPGAKFQRPRRRIRPAPMGRAMWQKRRFSHVTVELSDSPREAKAGEKKPAVKAGESRKKSARGVASPSVKS
jgi:large subunit ribosomal protein L22